MQDIKSIFLLVFLNPSMTFSLHHPLFLNHFSLATNLEGKKLPHHHLNLIFSLYLEPDRAQQVGILTTCIQSSTAKVVLLQQGIFIQGGDYIELKRQIQNTIIDKLVTKIISTCLSISCLDKDIGRNRKIKVVTFRFHKNKVLYIGHCTVV